METESTSVDLYNDNVLIIEDTETRHDAMGDITPADSMTLEDFEAEWVWKDNGIGKTPWFMKPNSQEKGYFKFGSKKFTGDYFETLLETMASKEEEVIKLFGNTFYNRANKLSKQLTGAREEVVWFVGEDGNQVMVREEVKTLVDILEILRTKEMPLLDMLAKYGSDKAMNSAVEAHKLFKTMKLKNEWETIKKTIIEGATYAKVDGEGQVSQSDIDLIVSKCQSILRVDKLSKIVFTFVVNLFWTAIKCRFEGNERAVLYKWLGAVSQEKDLIHTAENFHIDNFYVNN